MKEGDADMQEETNMEETPEIEGQKFTKIEHIDAPEKMDWADDEDGGVIDDGSPPGLDGDGAPEPGHLIRVGNLSNPNKLAYHIVKCIQMYGIAETQSIGPVALSKAIMAIVRAESIVSQYTTCEKLCVLPCIRKPTMRNGEERTALRLRIVPVHIQHLR